VAAGQLSRASSAGRLSAGVLPAWFFVAVLLAVVCMLCVSEFN